MSTKKQSTTGAAAAASAKSTVATELDELLSRFKMVTSKPKPGEEDGYADLRQKLSPLLKEYQEIGTLLKPLESKLNDVKKKKIELSEDDFKSTKARHREYLGKKKELESKLNAAMFSEAEVRIKTVGRGSQGYHYHGSGKILGRIGEAFAHAMAKLNGLGAANK